jgi:hypothetical protein
VSIGVPLQCFRDYFFTFWPLLRCRPRPLFISLVGHALAHIPLSFDRAVVATVGWQWLREPWLGAPSSLRTRTPFWQ